MEATVEVTAEVTVDNVLPIAVLDSGDPFNASLEGYSPLFNNTATVVAARIRRRTKGARTARLRIMLLPWLEAPSLVIA